MSLVNARMSILPLLRLPLSPRVHLGLRGGTGRRTHWNAFSSLTLATTATSTITATPIILPTPLLLWKAAQLVSGVPFWRRAHCEWNPSYSNSSEALRLHHQSLPPLAKYQQPPIESNVNPSVKSLFWQAVLPDWPLFLLVGGTAILTAVINLTTPRVIGKLVNVLSQALTGTTTSLSILAQLRQPAVHLLALFTAQGFLTFAYISFVSVLGERVAGRLRLALYAAYLEQDIAFFDQHRTGELVGRLTTDVAEFKHAFKNCIAQGLKSTTQIVGSFLHLLQLSQPLTLGILSSVPILYGFGNVYGAHLRWLSRDAKSKDAYVASVSGETLSNIRTVRAFANEPLEQQRFQTALEEAAYANEKLGFHIGIFQGLTNMSIGGMVLTVLYFGGNMVARGDLTGGDLMSYLLSIQNTQKSLAQMGVLFSQGVKATSAYQRIHEYTQQRPSIPLHGGIQLPELQGRIQFEHVDFVYPSRPQQVVLRDFSLEIPNGAVVALCGASGSGKSTIGALMERFYDPVGGEIRLDGVPLRELDPSWLRHHIGYIHQEPILFATTILENIRYAKPDATMDEVREAARQANAAEFIDGFPQGYATMVGERGVTLSGGQKQRIAIARALLKNPKILIFDEATSALDAQSERIVQDAMNRLMKDRTVLIIAHRLSTIEHADRIVVLAPGGQVLEVGSHVELMQREQGAYRRLYQSMHAVQGKEGIQGDDSE